MAGRSNIHEYFILIYLYDLGGDTYADIRDIWREFFATIESVDQVEIWAENLRKKGWIEIIESKNSRNLIITRKGQSYCIDNEKMITGLLSDAEDDFVFEYLEKTRPSQFFSTFEASDEILSGEQSSTNESLKKEDLQQKKEIPNRLHDAVLINLLQYKEKNKSFTFWLRERNTNNRLNEGLWFQGTEDYAHVGLYRANSGNRSTKSVGLVFWPNTATTIGLTFEVLYKDEKDPRQLEFYEWLRSTMREDFETYEDHGADRFKVLISINVNSADIFGFLEKYWAKFNSKVFELELDSIFISSEEFGSKYKITSSIRSKLLLDPTQNPEDSEVDLDELRADKEIEEENSKTDKTAFLWSDSATDIDELGRESLVKSVTESINELFIKYQDAYTVLLNGEWGSGKSSMLHFFEKHLGASGWRVIRYNAWENQKFSDPWWILINKISKYASEKSLPGEFTSHRYWKFKLQYKHKILALLLIAVFGVSAYFFSASFADPSSESNYDMGFYTSLIGLVGTFIGVITGLVNNFFFKSVSHEQLKQQFTEHPFEPIRKRFNQIAEENNLAIFIDDLDRCDVEATVSLLEGIQNLFKDVRVLYIIAADGQWVSNCFTQKYKSFDTLTNDGCSIGDKFLQKTFQLTLNVPKPNSKYLKLYWDNLIGHEESKPQVGPSSRQEEPKMKTSAQEKKKIYDAEINTLNLETEQKLADQKVEFEENIEKYLRKFLDQGVPENPRQMKRFVNQFEVTRQTLVVEGNIEKYGEDDKTVRFLIFSMRFPSIADKLKKGELTKEEILEADQNKKYTTDLTDKDRNDIAELLKDIDEILIKGDFYSI
ncbi:MAG: hypothetical protein ACJA08_001003 [Cyclobacteriaceae bacterium]|jgi:hypothetical protein